MIYMVFYAGLLYGEYAEAGLRLLQVQGSLEIYNGAFVYSKEERRWYRMDMTPYPSEHIPKELKAMLLLLT